MKIIDQNNKSEIKIYKQNVYTNIALINEKQHLYTDSLKNLKKALMVDPSNQKVQRLVTRMEQMIIGLNVSLINVSDI